MKILVFNPSFLGDSVLTTPLIKAVRHYFPDSSVDFCVRPENAPLFQGMELINEVIVFDKRKSAGGAGGIFRFARELKKRDYDIIISCHKSFRSTLTMALTGVLRRMGFRQSALSFLYTETADRDMSKHEAERNLMLLEPLVADFDLEDAKKHAGRAEVFTDERLRANAAKYIKSASGGRRLIGINAGSVWATKKWQSEKFAEVSDMLYEEGFFCVLFGAPTDSEACGQVMANAKRPLMNLCGKLPLGQLPSYIKAMDALITNDSGPLHIASAVGTPAVAIFGPTVKALGFFPYDDKSIVVEKELYCRPCGLHGGNECPEGHFRCMGEISAGDVFEAVGKVLK
ncbi:lipopolysaccharide heptosyltransferase II [Geovibrio thiophilus]|uniref:lipopolysaccharide heptosyltransferase II n=1 Tax=Geovibrio thiophilus TaxID=139438 RepID=UPI0013E31C87|nr:lipopolysaccharide heptosyltransferase II [Geovibrio thiophilus]